MRKIILLLFICIASSCDSRKNHDTKGSIQSNKLSKQKDIDSVKSLISRSFQDIWSDLNSEMVSNYYTTDFTLLENGMIWNNDSITNYLINVKNPIGAQEYRRINRFDFLKSVHNQTTIWIAYDNYAHWMNGNDTLRKAHWLESVVAIKENNTWKLQQLHSTTLRE